MKFTQEELSGGALKVTLEGALDIAGAGVIDLPFNIIAGSRKKILLDFTKVDFLASIGIRVLVQMARTVGQRGGVVVLLNPNDAARRVLMSTGVDTIIKLVDDEASAMAAIA